MSCSCFNTLSNVKKRTFFKMPHFIICGKPNCPNFVHGIYVAEYLRNHLPNFHYMKIEKSDDEWPDFVLELNKKNKWYFTKGPIIWKGVNKWGGKKYLIGSLSEFWEYCFCYYGFESIIPKSELIKLAKDNMKFFTEERLSLQSKERTTVAILGATNFMTTFLVDELTTVEDLWTPRGLAIRLQDEKYYEHPKFKKTLDDLIETFNATCVFGSRPLLSFKDNVPDAINGCDLIIYLEDLSRDPEEDEVLWFQRCLDAMGILADHINCSTQRTTRVVFCNEGPSCFLATCLVEFCTNLKPTNIVVVTADQGYSAISLLREISGVPPYRIAAPPVWGFVGYNCFVDEANTIFKAQVYRPYRRALTAPPGSTLPLGTVKSEIRKMSYIVHNHDEFVKSLEKKMELMEPRLGRQPVQGKLRALKSLLKLWYNEKSFDEIISLGVCSDGSFGIPPGTVFSQPVTQDEKHRWRPFTSFPLMDENTKVQISACVASAISIMERLELLLQERPEGSYSINGGSYRGEG